MKLINYGRKQIIPLRLNHPLSHYFVSFCYSTKIFTGNKLFFSKLIINSYEKVCYFHFSLLNLFSEYVNGFIFSMFSIGVLWLCTSLYQMLSVSVLLAINVIEMTISVETFSHHFQSLTSILRSLSYPLKA